MIRLTGLIELDLVIPSGSGKKAAAITAAFNRLVEAAREDFGDDGLVLREVTITGAKAPRSGEAHREPDGLPLFGDCPRGIMPVRVFAEDHGASLAGEAATVEDALAPQPEASALAGAETVPPAPDSFMADFGPVTVSPGDDYSDATAGFPSLLRN